MLSSVEIFIVLYNNVGDSLNLMSPSVCNLDIKIPEGFQMFHKENMSLLDTL